MEKTFFLKKKFTSEQIIANIRSKNNYEQTVKYLYDKYFENVQKLVVQLDGTLEDAEDIFQDALAKVIWSINEGQFSGRSHISTYLITVSKNMWLKTLAKRNKAATYTVDEKANLVPSNDDTLLQETPFEGREEPYTKALFEDVLSRLCKDCQLILKMYYFDEKTYAQILQLKKEKYSSEQAIRNKKSRCLKYLKVGLQGKIEDENSLLDVISSCL
ncbi:RNA polymerase sigma factor [Flammeovirga sp. EKP202]|uniref:RNA polymerase sigma factor n=1 Tax=Flammeovirga sp. EKP202 TaxID=2770592 RepID=UPI00165ED0C4|nr:sigma-70 family RNA polymerase sigma factor [Flammeovirga sp. EKP202]MBD0404948.1 sigma-70 family RNA polymerase sigma factor [Flammeovirga sp. EKP202]